MLARNYGMVLGGVIYSGQDTTHVVGTVPKGCLDEISGSLEHGALHYV